MVPAVTDISYRQLSQRRRFRRIDKASAPEHRGQTHPSGQRRAAKYSAQASSVLKRLSNSSKVLGKSSSMTPNTTGWGQWRQVHITIVRWVGQHEAQCERIASVCPTAGGRAMGGTESTANWLHRESASVSWRALYQGVTSVMPQPAQKLSWASAPAGIYVVPAGAELSCS